MIEIETRSGKRTCKYYKTCGNAENCKRCKSFSKKKNGKAVNKDD